MAGRDIRSFNTSTYLGDTEHLVLRMTEGYGSNKYKPVDYDHLRALASEKKFSSIKTSMKVKKIEQISAANKESSMLKQHQLVWHKEFLRLQHLRRKVQTEVESHLRQNSGTDFCGQIYKDFEYYDAGLTSSFDAFKQDTVEPLWNLRDDLRYWLTENRENLKLGDPEVIKKHAEILETVKSVSAQQVMVMEKLQYEQDCLEMELNKEDLRHLCPPVLEKHAPINEGIPVEAIDLECPDLTLKVSVLQEFLILDEKYKARVDDLKTRHALALHLDENGGWNHSDHFSFVAIHDQYPRELISRRTLLFDRLKRHLPHKTRVQLAEHEDWWLDYKYLMERVKSLYNDWARDRRELFTKIKLTFQEAILSEQLEELHSENVQRQRQICQTLYDKVREWREKKMEALQLEAELEAKQRARMEEVMKAEREEEKKRRQKEKEMIREYQAEKQHRHEEQEAELQSRLQTLRQQLAEQAIYDQERVKHRQKQVEEKLEERKKEQEKKEQEEKEREMRLEMLREQVRVIAESNPARTMQETKAWQAHHTEDEEHEYISIQKPLFDVHTFTSKQITSDPRIRVEQKLREAGLQNSEYARSVLAQVKPLQPPRKDMLSTHNFSNSS